MNRHTFELVFPPALILADFVALFSSFLLSFWLRFYSPLTSIFPVTKGIPSLELYIYSSLFVGLVAVLTLAGYGAYRGSRPKLFSDQVFPIFKAISLAFVIAISSSFFYRTTTFSRLMLVITWVLSLLMVSLARIILSKIEASLGRRGIGVRKAIVVATPQTAGRLSQHLAAKPQLGYSVIGSVVPNSDYTPASGYLGSLSELPQIISREEAEVVLMSLPLEYHRQMMETALKCDDLKVEFQIAPDMLELMTLKARLVSLDGIPFISLGKTPLEGWNRVVKRSFDIVCSSLGLSILSPLVLLLTLFVKLDSSGPVLFVQERLGRDGKAFKIFKFRTMKTDAEKETGPEWAKPHDQRRTRVGRILRKTSLDELPQLYNVLKGDMSLVGPRPERPFFVDKFKEDIPRYFLRHKVKSGITGWAQVHGLRGNTSIEERTKYDLYYVEHWTLGLDIKILLLTLRNVIQQENAY